MNNHLAAPGLAFLNNSPYGAYAVDFTQTTRYWNWSAQRITGHKAENVIGRSYSQVLQHCPAERKGPMCQDRASSLQDIRENQMPQVYDVSMLCAYGRRKIVTLTQILIPKPLISETVLLHLFHESADEKWLEQATRKVAQMFTTPGPLMETNEKLTPRELEILKFATLGMTPKEISEKLHISYHTVRKHTSNMRWKLRTDNNYRLVRRAQELGLV